MKPLFKRIITYILFLAVLLPTSVAPLALSIEKAYAASIAQGGGSGTDFVSGNGVSVPLNDLIITSMSTGDFTSLDGIRIGLTRTTGANLQFDETSDATVTPSSNLDLGAGDGGGISVTPLVGQINIPILTNSSQAGATVTVSGIKVKATSSGTTTIYAGNERLTVRTRISPDFTISPTAPNNIIRVDAQKPTFSNIVSTPNISGAGPVTITFNASEALIDNPLVTVNGNDATFISLVSGVYSYSYDITLVDPQGPAAIILNGADLVGNISDLATNSTALTIDTISPTTTLDITGLTSNEGLNALPEQLVATFSENIAFLGSASDYVIDYDKEGDFDGVDQRAVSVVGIANNNNDATVEISIPDQSAMVDAGGMFRLTVSANVKDTAGNGVSQNIGENDVTSGSILSFDTVAPTGSLSFNSGESYTQSQNVTLNIRTNDSNVNLMRVGNTSDLSTLPYESYAAAKSFTLPSGAGEKTVYVQLKDVAGNESAVFSGHIILLSGSQIGLTSKTSVTTNRTEVVVARTTSNDPDISVPREVANASLNLSQLLVREAEASRVTIPARIAIDIDTANGKIRMILRAGTVITGPSDWDGVINLAQPRSAESVEPKVEPDKSASDIKAWEIGANNKSLIFSQAVKLVFENQAGRSVGFQRNDEFQTISALCESETNPSISGNNECKTDSDSDLVLWTKHFTKFVTYKQVSTSFLIVPESNITTVERDEARFIRVEWLGIGQGVERYVILVNDVVAAIIPVSGDDTGVRYSEEIKVITSGEFHISIRAERGEIVSQSVGQKVEVEAIPARPLALAGSKELIQPSPATAKGPEEKKEEAKPEEKPAGDEAGVIKGEDKSEEGNRVNWTPWIILFALIVLTGGATAGYFYWFGEEEVPRADAKPVSEEQKPTRPVPDEKRRRPTDKRSKRW